jgi:hypothetical protein
MLEIWKTLTGVGGLLRVRAVLAISMTLGAVAYLLAYHEMPPTEYNTPWLLTIGWYFMARGSGG